MALQLTNRADEQTPIVQARRRILNAPYEMYEVAADWLEWNNLAIRVDWPVNSSPVMLALHSRAAHRHHRDAVPDNY